jgi:hypothetical protein
MPFGRLAPRSRSAFSRGLAVEKGGFVIERHRELQYASPRSWEDANPRQCAELANAPALASFRSYGDHHRWTAQQAEARRRRAEGATLAEPARSYRAGKSTISRLK